MIHLEGVFYIIVLYHTRRALPVIHRVITPLRVVFFTPVLTHLFIRPFIGVKQLHPGPTLYEFSIFRGGPRNVCYSCLATSGRGPGEASTTPNLHVVTDTNPRMNGEFHIR